MTIAKQPLMPSEDSVPPAQRRTGVGVAWRLLPMLAIAAALLSLSCGTTRTQAPEPKPIAAIQAWHDALKRGAPEAAYELLSERLQAQYTRAGFVALYMRQKQALIAQAEALVAHARSATPTQSALVKVGEHPVALTMDDGQWRLRDPATTAMGKNPLKIAPK